MPTNFGPNPDTTSLVVSLDSADIKQSYFGEPTTNESPNTNNFSGTSYGYGGEWLSNPTVLLKQYVAAMPTPIGIGATLISESGQNGFHHLSSWGGGSESGEHSLSCYIYPITSDITNFTIGLLGDGGNRITFNIETLAITYGSGIENRNAFITPVHGWPGWYRIGANYEGRFGGWVGCMGYSTWQAYTGTLGSKRCYIAGIQYEFKTHPTAFTVGTRTADQALRNPVNGVFSGLSTMSFKANNNFTFDGTDDSFGVTTPQYTSARNFTFIAWVKSNGVLADGRRGIMYGSTSSGYISFFGYNGQMLLFETRDSQDIEYLGVGTSGFSIYDGTWAMVGFQIANDSLKAFYGKGGTVSINTNSDTRAGNFTFNGFTVGRDSSGFRWNGDIDGIKFFNRILSETELTEYYQQNKNRFV